MAWVTTLGPSMAQIDYRLDADAGCSLHAEDGQVAYRLDSDRPLEWVGDGLREVGIEPGSVLDEDGKDAARALADGADPRTGAVLVAPKLAMDPRSKLPARPLVDAIRVAAETAGTTPAQLLGDARLVARYGRLQRGLAREEGRGVDGGMDRETVAHRAPVKDLERLAAAAGVRLRDVYGDAELALARAYRDARVVVGNRGYDLTLDLPKSYSVLMALAPAEVAGQLEEVYLDAVRETVTAMQGWAGYGMRGHHGDGEHATRVGGTGLLGWMTVHRTARPVAGQAPDPHLHAHVTLLNLVRGVDGQWSTVGAGGRDIHRHASAADALVKARLRQVTSARWGVVWDRDPRTGAWEIAAVPPHLRRKFSKRAGQVQQQLHADGVDPAAASTARAKTAAAASREAKQRPGAGGDLRGEWHAQARAAGVDPAALVAAAMPGPDPGPGTAAGPSGPGPRPPGPDRAAVPVTARQVAAHIFRPEEGLTGHRKVTTRAEVLAAVLDAVPAGVTGLGEAEQLADEVLALDVAVPLPPAGAIHLTNAGRYSSIDILDAERAVLQAARDRFDGGYAVVPAAALSLAVAQFEAANGFSLGAEQRAVLQRLATAGHGVDAVVGVAGAGKTTIMAALRVAYEATGQIVGGAATAAVAAQNLQTEAGIASRTVASWLQSIAGGRGLAGVDVLVVDEAAMVDDRHLAQLLHAAGDAGTKVVAIGDPMQLKAVGVGGTFAAVHDLVGGLQLGDNRRQRDVQERHALAVWRAERRRAALHAWNDTGRLHVTAGPADAHAAIVDRWAVDRRAWADPHERIARLLVLAHTNADVDALNTAARAVRVAAGELPGPARSFPLPDGRQLTLAVGDQVLLRTNDREAGVLNGYRGIVTAIDPAGRVQIEHRRIGPDGPQLLRAWVTAGYVTAGGVSLGYAITAAKAQGLTADQALVYATGMEANVLYPAMSRDRERADLWLALDVLEDDSDRARHGTPASDAEARARAVAAYAAKLEHDRPDGLILTELDQYPDPITPRPDTPTPAAPAAAEPAPAAPTRPDSRTAAYWDAVAAQVAQLPDDAPPAVPDRQQLARRARLADLDPARFRQAETAHRRDLLTELHALAAGEDPSGRYTRAELDDAARRMRAAAQRHERADALRDMLAQVRQRPDSTRAGHVDWRHRPHGDVPTDQLLARIAAAEERAAHAADRARHHDQLAAASAAQATAGQGPAMARLLATRHDLAAQVDAGEQLTHLLQAQAAARDTERHAWAEIRRLDSELRRNPIALRLAGTSRAELTAEQEQLREQARTAGTEAARHTAPIDNLQRAAAGPAGARHAADHLADLVNDWDRHTAAATATDQRTADRHRNRAAQHRTDATQWQQTAARLHHEAQLRASMHPPLAQAEDLGRSIHQARTRVTHLRQDTTHAPATAPQYDYDHYPSPDIDHGPHLGL